MSQQPPSVPNIELSVFEDRSPDTGPGFLALRRQLLRASFPDGTTSEPFEYDHVTRRALDAVIIVAHYRDATGERHVYLRSGVRPPLSLRTVPHPVPQADLDTAVLWEMPAGLVEPHEQLIPEGPARCAARELAEELGFDVPAEKMLPLGTPTVPAPALISERHYYFQCEVDPTRRGTPTEDGSALERNASILDVRLEDAMRWVRRGSLPDAKTELALRRLEELVP